jgi:HTH-type transcriptional regulator, sugar sensing transcriptional regulator
MSDINTILQNLGLTEKESQIYLGLLEIGSGTVQEIATKSGVKRTNIYNLLSGMKNKGLISEVKQDNKTLLIPENPDVLVKRAQDNLKNIQTSLPEIIGIFNTPGNKPKVKFFEGKEGLKRAYQDIVDTGETNYGFSDYEKMFQAIEPDWLWQFPTKRVAKKIFFYCIAKNGPNGRAMRDKDKEHLRKTKLTKDLKLDTEINVYGNKVSFHSFRRPYAAVIIEDRAIAESIKSIWQGWWNLLPE